MDVMKITCHENITPSTVWKQRKDKIVSSLRIAADCINRIVMRDPKDWGEAGNLGKIVSDVEQLTSDLKEMGYLK